VRAAYLQKIQRKPNDKRDAIIKELEQEFGLESRRIRAMIKEVGRLLP
jgi:hypothetical protein